MSLIAQTQAAELPLHVLTATSVLAFLSHLESERGNSVRSRNARLAAIRSFLHYVSDLLGSELPEPTGRRRPIPYCFPLSERYGLTATTSVKHGAAWLQAGITRANGRRIHARHLLA